MWAKRGYLIPPLTISFHLPYTAGQQTESYTKLHSFTGLTALLTPASNYIPLHFPVKRYKENRHLHKPESFWIFIFLGTRQFGLFLMTFQWSCGAGTEGLFLEVHFNIPPVCGVQLHSDHIEGVPGWDGQSVVQTQHTYHHGFAGAKPKEETADPWKHHRATCQQSRQNTGMFPVPLVEQGPLGFSRMHSNTESQGEAVDGAWQSTGMSTHTWMKCLPR